MAGGIRELLRPGVTAGQNFRICHAGFPSGYGRLAACTGSVPAQVTGAGRSRAWLACRRAGLDTVCLRRLAWLSGSVDQIVINA